MPWEKSFDEQEAIDKAIQVFWSKGFEATSINDLIERTGINRGSLYNAFGGKRQLFVKALLKYDGENRRKILAELEALDDPKQAFHMLFDGIVTETTDDHEKKGCFLINTALELPAHDDETREIVTKGLKDLEAFFRRGIEVAQARHDMPSTLAPATTAKALVSLVVAIRVLGRGAFAESDLRAIADEAARLIA